MENLVRKIALVGLAAGGLLVWWSGTAGAAEPDGSVAVAVTDVSPQAGVTVCGVSVGLLGDAAAGCPTGDGTATSEGTGADASGTAGVGDGLAALDVAGVAPAVDARVCGISIGVLGGSTGSCPSGTAGPDGQPPADEASDGGGALVDAGFTGLSPSSDVSVCGVSVGVGGRAEGSCATAAAATLDPGDDPAPTVPEGGTGETGGGAVFGAGVLLPVTGLAAAVSGGLLPVTGLDAGGLLALGAGLLAAGGLAAGRTRRLVPVPRQ